MAKTDIWMPVYIGDYLRDTEELSSEEHGVYLLLLMHYWQKKGEIGCDIDRLARVARTNEETARFILGYFFTIVDGNYKNKRADQEIQNADNRRESARENGQKGGRPSKNNPQITGGLTGGFDLANRAGNPQKSSSSSPSYKENNSKEQFDIFWTQYPKKVSKPQAMKTYNALIKKGVSHDSILLCLENYNAEIRATGKELQYVKNPSTFLNNYSDYEKRVTISPTEPIKKKLTCRVCGSENLGPGCCRDCGWDLVQTKETWLAWKAEEEDEAKVKQNAVL